MRYKIHQMLQLKLRDHLTKEELKKKLVNQVNVRSFRQWQILYAVACNEGRKSEAIAVVLGITNEILQRTVKQYNENGPDFQQKIKWGGRRKETSFLSLEEEQKMLADFAKKASEGKILTAKAIRREIEKKLKREVSDDYIWDLFNRCGWSKKAPRPQHPKQDLAAQEDFKKNSPKSWQPSM